MSEINFEDALQVLWHGSILSTHLCCSFLYETLHSRTEATSNHWKGPVVSILYNRLGPTIPTGIGAALSFFGLMMTAWSTKFYQLILFQGVFTSVGLSLAYHTAVQATPTWFDKKRSFAFGIGMVGSSLGGVIYPIMMTRLVDEVGFPWAMRTVAFLTGFLLVGAFPCASDTNEPLIHADCCDGSGEI
jgi:MFS family permease